MTVQIIIHDNVIEEIPVDFSGCRCYEEKWGKIVSVANWLKWKYRMSITLLNNWEIVGTQESKFSIDKTKPKVMNNIYSATNGFLVNENASYKAPWATEGKKYIKGIDFKVEVDETNCVDLLAIETPAEATPVAD